jgi:anti-sigma regulatory factor (Ser/Thr protein kinase)
MRAARLEALQEGFVRVHLQVQPRGKGGRLVIRVEDSGKGFDVARVMQRPLDNVRLSGRGISLVRQLGHNASWSDQGRSASVEFFWEIEA